MRTFFPAVAGNRVLCEKLGAELADGRFSHAYIIEGAKGCGKHTLARQIAMAVACRKRSDPGVPLPCGECPACRKILSGNCPDLLWFSRAAGKASMGVDTVRALREDLALVPNELDVKILIIEDADTMTVQAQNAFLLTLEEPPPFVLFLLLAENAANLLETVRSRAPVFRLGPVDDETLTGWLTHEAPPALRQAAVTLLRERPEEFAALLRLSGGAVGVAEELLDDKKRAPLMAERETVNALLAALFGRQRDALVLTLAGLPQNRDAADGLLSLFAAALRDLVLLSRSETVRPVFFTDREAALDLAARCPLTRLLGFTAATDTAREALAINANVRLTLSRLADQLLNA